MAAPRPRIAVFGAGLIGLHVGGLLAQAADVVLIGRASRLASLDAGLRLTDVDGLNVTVSPGALARATAPEALAGADLVLVTVKSLGTAEAATAIAAHAPTAALVISLQNGVSNADMLRAALPGRSVLAGMVPYNVAERAPAHLHRGTGGRIVLEAAPVLDRWQPLFPSAGLDVETSTDIVAVLWGKLLVNLNNAINALSGLSLMAQLRQRDYRRAWALSLSEGLRLVRASGIVPADPLPIPLNLMPQILRLPDWLYRRVVSVGSAGKAKVDPHARSSMADDLARGRPTEIDSLQGEIVRLADRLGRAAPVNARLIDLIRAAEAGAPPIPAAELLQQLRRAHA
jgi:2-dehydropantoate 2-reductase